MPYTLQEIWVIVWDDGTTLNSQVYAEDDTGQLLDDEIFTNDDLAEARALAMEGAGVEKEGMVLYLKSFSVEQTGLHLTDEENWQLDKCIYNGRIHNEEDYAAFVSAKEKLFQDRQR